MAALRGKNFTESEEILLVQCWLNISTDVSTGTGQKAIAFWDRIATKFNQSGDCDRTSRSLETKWAGIQKACAKFSGAYSNICALDESGKTEEDKIRDATKV